MIRGNQGLIELLHEEETTCLPSDFSDLTDSVPFQINRFLTKRFVLKVSPHRAVRKERKKKKKRHI